ncbi:peptidoglycan-binding protein [Streptomyces anulatus]|uniref:peptidoglycan-binding domain-containing protein n=3 Tax=Streptomyces TaxID=1883 RepID=UPI003249F6E0|nr:peptidoglycan-binding protein [Streptomyces anulatus]
MPCRCGAGAPSARLTEDEQRAARTAEIAAAEDFDPLRIRPYVTLTDHTGAAGDRDGAGGPRSGSSGTWEGAASGTREGSASWTGTPEPDAAGAAGAVGADRAAGAVGAAIDPGAAATTMPLFPGGDGPDAGVGVGVGSPGGATHPVPDGSRRRTATAGPAFDPDPVRPRRRRPFGALAVGAAVAAVVGTAAFAGGLFGGDDSTDEALPEATTSAPDTEDEPAASVAPSPSASANPPREQSPSATPSASPSASASASPTKSREPAPTASTSASASPTASASPAPDGGAPPAAPSAAPPAGVTGGSLRPGDRGPEVAELQIRLRTVGEWLYSGPVDGSSYSDQVAYSVAVYQSYKAIQGDPTGVYGPNTRRALEAETNGRGRH